MQEEDYSLPLFMAKSGGIVMLPGWNKTSIYDKLDARNYVFHGANAADDAASMLFSNEYRAAMGNRPYGVRIDYQNKYGKPFNFEVPYDEYLRTKAEVVDELSKPLEKKPNSILTDAEHNNRNKFRANTARTLDSFYVDSESPNAAKTSRFYLNKGLGAVSDSVERIPISTFQTPTGNVHEDYGLSGGKRFGGTATSHAEGMAAMPNVDTSSLQGRELGLAISSDPDNELFVHGNARHDPRNVRYAGHAVDAGEPTLVVRRPAVNQNLFGEYVPRGTGAYVGNAIGAAGVALTGLELAGRKGMYLDANPNDRFAGQKAIQGTVMNALTFGVYDELTNSQIAASNQLRILSGEGKDKGRSEATQMAGKPQLTRTY